MSAFKAEYDEGDYAGAYKLLTSLRVLKLSIGKARIHLSTERWRACEAWFSPSMAGVDSAGLAEVMQNVLTAFSENERTRLVGVSRRLTCKHTHPTDIASFLFKNVFATGGPSQLPGLEDRLHTSLRPILPPGTPLNISRATDPIVDAWKGMAAFASTDAFKQVGITRAEYDEMGGERIKRWWGSNWNFSITP